MPDPTVPPVPESRAVPRKQTRLSVVWLVPIIAALAGAWVAVTRIMNEGPKITITFDSAEGLEAGKTEVHYNGVTVGTLKTIRLSDDHRSVVATAQMAPKTENLLVEDTRFWVVRPRISGATVSGLGTLISGSYIGMEIGDSKRSKREFVALTNPPVVAGDFAGPLLRAEGDRPGLARHRHARLLSPAPGRRGGGVHARQGRQGVHHTHLRAGAVRPVRDAEHALLAGERHRHVAVRRAGSVSRRSRCSPC